MSTRYESHRLAVGKANAALCVFVVGGIECAVVLLDREERLEKGWRVLFGTQSPLQAMLDIFAVSIDCFSLNLQCPHVIF